MRAGESEPASRATPKPLDSIWLTPSDGCSGAAVAIGRLCFACDASTGPEACHAQCDAGVGSACAVAGVLYDYGMFGPQEPTKAYELYARACALGSSDGCMHAASDKMHGVGVPKDEAGALVLFRRLCREHYALGCRAAAIGYLGGRSATIDTKAGLTLLNEACALSDRIACQMAKDPRVTQDVDEAEREAEQEEVRRRCRSLDRHGPTEAMGECIEP